MTVFFVEHDMDMVHDVSDWVIVMAEGGVIAEGTPDDIVANTDVIDAYLGSPPGPVAVRTSEAEPRDFDAFPGPQAASLRSLAGARSLAS